MGYEVHRGDLQDSPYTLEHEVFNEVKFYFSSQKAIDRFNSRLYSEIAKGDQKLSNIFKGMFKIDCALLSAIRLYSKEERRGFLVEIEGEKYTQPHTIEFFIDA